MRLGDLVLRLPGARLSADAELVVSGICHDSRRCTAGSLFVAIRGLQSDGNEFADAARRKGAVAVVSEREARPGVPWIQVSDARTALAECSAALLGDPARSLALVGVTGTNGKTTTSWLIEAALREAGHRTGLLGTVEYRIAGRSLEAVRTTPESSDLQALFRQMVDAGCSHAVLEVSSHSLALQRVHGCPFQVAVFTNLTRDHLDFHGDMDAYFAAKRVLFESLLREDGVAVINAEDERAEALTRASRGRVATYAIARPADYRAHELELTLTGSRFRVWGPDGDHAVAIPLIGRFNAMNALAAFAAAHALGIAPEVVARGLASVAGVPGRLERVDAGQEFTVIVDYAHTDDALKNLLETVKELRPRRVITVFGCGGDRDRSKRPLMGAVAMRLSDVVVVTSDNPRTEPPESIIEEIQLGMAGPRRGERHVVVDRREAISKAVDLAQPGDAVVIAGKGHETYQTIRDRNLPFDDRLVAREALARQLARGAS
jgi:UDP-N-acetylmuramoyl-L-alanyl-D-glutamate--2,6-diaminopimelate ligase